MTAGMPPLDGLRILDFSQVAAGPYATSLLGDLGADVVKIEGPRGDPFRDTDNIFGPGESGYFFGINRSKRSMSLDLEHPDSRLVLDRMLRWADVVLVGFRPSAVRKLGLDYERVSAVNPRIIYCSLTAFGEDGPRSDEPGMDILAQALSGVMATTGEPGRAPVKVGPPIADFVASYLIGFAICAAIIARERDGVGQKIALNLLDGQLASMANYIAPYLRGGKKIRPVGGGHPQLVPYQVFRARDGYMIVACMSNKFWPPLLEAIGMQELNIDRFASNAQRVDARTEIVSALQRRFETESVGFWLPLLREAGVPCGPVNQLEDALVEPQVLHNGMLLELKHPVHGTYGTVNNPLHFDGTPAQPHGYAPGRGEHTAEFLTEIGLTTGEVAVLRESKVVEQAPSLTEEESDV